MQPGKQLVLKIKTSNKKIFMPVVTMNIEVDAKMEGATTLLFLFFMNALQTE